MSPTFARGIKLAPKLMLPIEMVGESTAILAKKGAGKSNTAKVIVEEVLDHGGVQVVALDPIGHWWSLRAGADGKAKGGYEVAVFGGMHGDLPLEEHAGKLLAQTIVDSGQSVVLDVSGLDSNGAMQRFVYELLEELYKLKQGRPSPLLLVLEEADEFAPQDPKGANVPRMVGAAARISKRGRGRGIGMLYVTQRSAALNKNVLDQADTLIVMRTIGPRDRKAIEGWVRHQDADGMDLVLPSLPGLATGEAWVWAPERGLLERVKIRKARTFDSSESPADRLRRGEETIEATVKPIDVEALGAAIQATVERVRENDPAVLKKRVRDLTAQVASLEQKQGPDAVEVSRALRAEKLPDPPEGTEWDLGGWMGPTAAAPWPRLRLPDPETVEVPVIQDEQLVSLNERANQLEEVAKEITSAILAAREKQSPPNTGLLSSDKIQKLEPATREAIEDAFPPAWPRTFEPPEPTFVETTGEHLARTNGSKVTGPQQRILNSLAWWETVGVHSPSRGQIAFVADYHARTKSFTNALSSLSSAGQITYPSPGYVSLTDAGRAYAEAPSETPSEHDLQQLIYHQIGNKLTRILQPVVQLRGEPVSRDDLAQVLGYHERTKSFTNGVSRLSSLGLVVYPRPGLVAASPLNFLEG